MAGWNGALRSVIVQMWVMAFAVAAPSCSPPDLGRGLDLTPPRVVELTPRDGAAVSVTPVFELEFSEPVTRASVMQSLHLVPFALGASCQVDLACGVDARCVHGRCQRDPLDRAWLADLRRPPLRATRRMRTVGLRVQVTGRSARVRVQRPLDPLRQHTLVLSAVVRDHAGNTVVPRADGLVARRTVMSGVADSGQPVLWLRSPPAGSVGLPTNLARVVVASSEPVSGVSDSSLGLLWGDARLSTRVVRASPLCRDRPRGTCHVIALSDPLAPLSTIRLWLDGAQIRDRSGQQAFPIAAPAFATGTARDNRAPRLLRSQVQFADGCVVARVRAAEPVDAVLTGPWSGPRVAVGRQEHELAARPAAGTGAPVRLELTDLAGNRRTIGPLTAPGAAAARVAISEILANPAGPEPGQEFVELRNLSTATVDVAGWRLDDHGDGIKPCVLPGPAKLPAGAFALVVGKSYQPGAGPDPTPPAGTMVIRLQGLIGQGGLSNRGERLTLRDAGGALVSAYGDHIAASGASWNGRSVERIDHAGCDVSSNYRGNPDGTSSPGR